MELLEKVVSFSEALSLDLVKKTILVRKPYSCVTMVHLLESNFFDYSLRFDQDYAYLWNVLDSVTNADIDILTATSKDATALFHNFVKKVYDLLDKQDQRYVHGCQLIHQFKTTRVMAGIFKQELFKD